MTTHLEIAEQFRQVMAQAGIVTQDEILADGGLHRFHVEGDKPGRKNGWYILHGDTCPWGAFGSWKLGIKGTWKGQLPKGLSKEEREAAKAQAAKVEAEWKAKQERQEAKAQKTAAYIWEHATPAADDHPYLNKKQITPNGARLHEGKLVLPVCDAEGTLQNLQFIFASGEKRFLSGGRTAGCCYGLGKPTKRVYIAEGFATGATIHEVTHEAVAIAFDAGNLKPVAEALRKKYPKTEIVIAGDDDQWTDGNPGKTKALEAAKAVKGKLALPKFRDVSTHPTDFNDLSCLESTGKVKEFLKRARVPEMWQNIPGVLAKNVKPEKVRWLWLNRIPLGEVTMLEGDPGIGKSTVTLDWAARVTQGWGWPDEAEAQVPPRGVVIVSLEDSPSHTIRPRLETAGADLERVRVIETVTGPDGIERTATIPQDLFALEKAIQDVDAALLIVDPLIATFDQQTNSWKDQDVRRAIAPLKQMAERLGIAVVTLRHLNKSQAVNPLYRGGGSIAFIAGARAGMLAAKDSDNPGSYVLAMTKSNLAAEQPSLRYRIEGSSGVAQIVWEGESPHKAVDLLVDSGGEEEGSARREAEEGLRVLLANGPVPSKDVAKWAKDQRISDITFRRARKALGVRSTHTGQGRDTKWFLALSEMLTPPAEMLNIGNMSASAQITESTTFTHTNLAEMLTPDILSTSAPQLSPSADGQRPPAQPQDGAQPAPETARPSRPKREKPL